MWPTSQWAFRDPLSTLWVASGGNWPTNRMAGHVWPTSLNELDRGEHARRPRRRSFLSKSVQPLAEEASPPRQPGSHLPREHEHDLPPLGHRTSAPSVARRPVLGARHGYYAMRRPAVPGMPTGSTSSADCWYHNQLIGITRTGYHSVRVSVRRYTAAGVLEITLSPVL